MMSVRKANYSTVGVFAWHVNGCIDRFADIHRQVDKLVEM